MTVEETNTVEVELECPPDGPPVAIAIKTDEEKAMVPVEPQVVAEKPAEVCEEKQKEASVNRDDVLAKVAMEKSHLLKHGKKVRNLNPRTTQQKLSSIKAWENSKKAELEAELKKIEEDLETKKAKYIEKMKNKVVLVHKTAEEKRAITEAKCREDILKAEEVATKLRATGETPKKLLGWFKS
ncbi:hypothetical protein E3N88_12735 [Mikania micrantha]|uniref:Remorin C-terminal domain-containing protein n=1 Tax=Mikania micrantha TaxID=192012 RepID=A0A5N6P9B5_9ASTR|nr:hypothetical protein E3N88_12735 [Mikania micrantha]